MGIRDIFKRRPQSCVSIDFGRSFVKIAYVDSSAGGFIRVLSYEIWRIPEGMSGDVAGFIRSFLKKNSIAGKEAVLSISEPDSLLIRYLTLPVLPEEEVEEALRWQLKEEVHFGLEEAILDWQQIREYSDADGAKKNGIIVTVAKKELINNHLSIIRECGLNPFVITSSPFNYANIIRGYPGNPRFSAVLDIGSHATTLSIYERSKLSFVRTLSFSPDKLSRSLTGALVSDKGRIELPYEEAENIRDEFGIPEDSDQALRDNIQAAQVISLMRPLLESLVREVRFSFDYFASNFEAERPASLYITGGGANLKNLDRYLAKEFNITVSCLPFSEHIDTHLIDGQRIARERNQITSVLGAAAGIPGEINLLPAEIKTQKAEFIQKALLRLAAITIGAIFLFLWFTVKFQELDYKNRLRAAMIHLQALGELKAVKQKIDLREGLIDRIRETTVPAEGLLKLLSTLIPREAVLDELTLEQRTHLLLLKGRIFSSPESSERLLGKFIQTLEKSSFLNRAVPVSLRNTDAFQEFEIRGELIR